MKPCSKCGVPKELSDFDKRKISKDGYRSVCKLCRADQTKEYYDANKDRLAERRKEYRKANKDRLAERRKEYRKANKERVAERRKEYRKANKERIKEYLEANKDRLAERGKEWREANKERVAERDREYRKANPDKIRSRSAKRRSAKLNASPPWIAAAERLQIEEFYTLAIMQSGSTGKDHHVDHIHPLIHPLICGLHVPSNLQILEASVNCSKNNKFEPYIESECDFTELWQVRSNDRILIPTTIDRIPKRNPNAPIKPKKTKAVPKGQLALF